ncbi:MAG TPA: flagellar protein FlgN [Peptococcaceae bacterium]|nr:flagellar protein FlgN [Clostridia bacterium]HOB82078.1 flagellar protein FlgN [Peptococcaceae bacterium]HQD54186.1 flagellar protein FlgN [Peptococcaceae bacterium]
MNPANEPLRGQTINRLTEILSEQKKLYERLLELSRQKQKHLIKNNLGALEEIVAQEEGLVLQVSKLEEGRVACFSCLAGEYGLNAESTLLEFLQHVAEHHRAQLKKLHEDLSGVLLDLRQLNQENTALLEQSLQFVNFTMDVLSQQSKPLYNADHEIKVERLTNFLDKKA